MLAYMVKRIVWGIVLFFVVTIFTFVIFFVLPATNADITRTQSGESVRQRSSIRTAKPLHEQYVQFLRGLRHGSLGTSWVNRKSVLWQVKEAVPVTASLIVGGMIMWLSIALVAGLLSALRPRSLLDRGAMIFVLIGISVHPVWIGSLLIYFFGYRAHLAPLGGYCRFVDPQPDCGGLGLWAWHLMLPWFTFALLYAAIYTRMIRACVIEALDEDYVRTAVAKGASSARVIQGHVLRNAMLPVVTMLGMDIGFAFAGSIFVERVFGLPGLGQLAYRSLQTFDLPVILGVVGVLTVAILVFNLLVDILYAWLDPRVTLAGRRDKPVKAPEPRAEPAPATAST